MPPAVLADSEDDSDDLGAFECEDTVASSRGSRMKPAEGARDGVDGVGGMGGADDRSTGSTELLKRQILSAERGLLATAPEANQLNSSASPAKQAAKRRHTAVFGSESNASPPKGVKRSKTLKTYGGSRRQLEPTDNGEFDRFRNDEGPGAPTSPSVRVSEHSEQQSSTALPAGTIQADFIDHEPAMFRDTGDTVADASSEQQRMLVQAIASKKALSTSPAKDTQQHVEQNSSSIPWTASDIANSAKSRKSETAHQQANENAGNAGERGPTPAQEETADATNPAPVEKDKDGSVEAVGLHQDAKLDEFGLRRPKSSPMVEIPRQAPRKPTMDDDVCKPTERTSKSRKSVREESSEPLNSDDRAIGLPKELYQPRLSKRRATQTPEEPIDYSVIPETKAKLKRTKTTGAKTSVTAESKKPAVAEDLKQGVSPPGLNKDGLSGSARTEKESPTKQRSNEPTTEHDESPVKRRRTIKQSDEQPVSGSAVEERSDSGREVKEQAASPVKPNVALQEDEDQTFVKPTIPTPKPKGSAKAKRAQTTIFEDHVGVEFLGSRRSPNLSQQQAKRKSALQDVTNEAGPKSKRSRKSVVADDSDDEDDLAKENEIIAETKPAPKKRPGRPSKADKAAQLKATDSVMKDSDEDDVHDDQPEADESEDDEPPKKRGRGRPAKAANKATAKEKSATAAGHQPVTDLEKAADKDESTAPHGSQPETTPLRPSAPAAEMPTPSPDKASENKEATPQKAGKSAAQHSPIKSSSKMPLRVGLSKRHRIPPLLRMTRPPAKAPTRR